MEAMAKARFVRISPQRVRWLMNEVRGKKADEAIQFLTFSPQKGARILKKLIDQLYSLTNVFPVARLHDCASESGEEASITLNNTSLGSL